MSVKKFILIAAAVAAIALFCSCGKNEELNVSQLRTDILTGTDNGCEFTAYPEMREMPLIADGKAGVKVPVVIVKIINSRAFSGTYSIFIKIGDKEYSASPETVSDNMFKAVIPVEHLPEGSMEISLKGENEYNAKLNSVISEEIADYKIALAAAKNELGDKVVYESNASAGEFFVRIISENDRAFWYVGFITAEKVCSVLVSADGKQIVATKDFRNAG